MLFAANLLFGCEMWTRNKVMKQKFKTKDNGFLITDICWTYWEL